MSSMKKVLVELQKGKYDNITKPTEFIQALMDDFKVSRSTARYIQVAHFHYLELD